MSDETAQKVMPAHGTFCWNELMTRDPEAAGKFYSELIGWNPTKSEMPGMDYTMMKNNGSDAGGMMKMPAEVPAEVPSHWMAYITVDDVDAAMAKVAGLGGTVLVPAQDIPHVGRFCMVQDPTGASVGLITLNKPE
jgi:predicted enzyme related to lactoylglutathione lyase